VIDPLFAAIEALPRPMPATPAPLLALAGGFNVGYALGEVLWPAAFNAFWGITEEPWQVHERFERDVRARRAARVSARSLDLAPIGSAELGALLRGETILAPR